MRIATRAACATVALFVCNLACSVSRGAEPATPESLLSGESVVYLRFDGLAAHQAELDKTVLAQLLAEDLHPLLDYLKKLALDAAGPDVVAERLLAGAEPDRLIEMQKAAKQMPLLVENVGQRGLLLGVETTSLPMPGAQATLVFPGAGEAKYRDAVFAAVQILGVLNDREVEEATVGDRTMLKVSFGPVALYCWQEGEHVVSTFGMAPPDGVIALAQGEGKSLTANPLFEQLGEFEEYETYARGFFDTKSGIDFVQGIFPPAVTVLDKIGVGGLTAVRFHLGCRDELLRGSLVLDTVEERKGILAAFSAAEDLKVEELPPLPPDAGMVVAASLDAGGVYDASANMIEILVQTLNPVAYEQFKSERDKFERKLGGDIRRDLNDALDNSAVFYTSPSEGAMFFSSALAFKVKDEAKLHAAVERLFRTLAEYGGATVEIRRKPYRDGELNVIEFDTPNVFPFSPTYSVRDGWFVIGLTPQPAQGLIVRSSGKFATWKPAKVLTQALAEAGERRTADGSPAKVFAVTQIDPRPTVTMVLSYSSFIAAIVRARPGAQSGYNFDTTLIPHAQAINERLSPNAAVVVDDGKSLRIDTYDTLPLPFDISGFGNLALPGLFFGFAF